MPFEGASCAQSSEILQFYAFIVAWIHRPLPFVVSQMRDSAYVIHRCDIMQLLKFPARHSDVSLSLIVRPRDRRR